MIYDGDTITKDGRTFRINIEPDQDMGAPWDEHDGHGVVLKWTSTGKRPHYLVLDRDGPLRRYDVKASLVRARDESWGLGPEEKAAMAAKLGRAPTAREITAEAVRRDYEYLRRWCNDQWCWVGVIVTDITDNPKAKIDYSHALWGVQSDEGEYLKDVAMELIDQILGEIADDWEVEQREADEVTY